MKPAELAAPIRIYWDIGAGNNITLADYQRIAGEISSNKILYLQLTETSPELSRSSIAVLDILKNKPLALSLAAPLDILSSAALELLGIYPLKVVFATTDASGFKTLADMASRHGAKPAIGLSFPVDRENYQELPNVLAFCIEQRIPHLLVPMQRLTSGEHCFVFSKDEQRELTKRLSELEKPGWLKITIHDPFVWRAFYPSVEFPNGGCQAANTMLYIAPNAEVYACPMLPIKIGNLLESRLSELIKGDKKHEVRKQILRLPGECTACDEVSQCNGGCRGRALVINSAFTSPDPACR